MNDERVFWQRVKKTKGCWLWLGSTNNIGYGKFCLHGRYETAHRLSWRFVHGSEAAGELDHICHNRACVNPEHLRVCSRSENCCNTLLRRDSTHGLKGVKRNGNNWAAEIQHAGVRKHLGTYKTPQQAHEAYCRAAQELHGAFANNGTERA